MLTTYPNVEQRTPEWYDQRRGIVTASAVSKLLTPTLQIANNETSRAYTATLVAERLTDTTENTPVSTDMWRGIEMEPFARDEYSTHYQQATTCGFMRRDGDGWTLGYSPDGLVHDNGLIEIKCPRAANHLQTLIADQVPSKYMPQLQAALLVSGREWIDFVSYHGGLPLFVKRVTPDANWHIAIIEACKTFEANAARLMSEFEAAAVDKPTTERIDLEVVI